MSVHDVRLDLDRHLVWVAGDIGIALAGGPSYAPYDFNGINLGPEQLPEFGESQNWFRYGHTDRSPWQLSVEYFSLPGPGLEIQTWPQSYRSQAQFFCQECGRDVSRWADQDGRAADLKGLVDYLCHSCALKQAETALGAFGDYRLLMHMGEGNRVSFYKAWQARTCWVVVLCIYHPNALNLPSTAREFHMIRDLKHPNLVTPIASGQVGDKVFTVHELNSGKGLDNFLSDQGGRLPVELAVGIISQILEGLNYLHQKDLVHRDVKPGNILIKNVDQQMVARLTEFGLLKNYQTAGFDGEMDGTFAGTFPFMPPEQVTSFPYVKPTADIYASGATLYYLLTGCYPLPFKPSRGLDPIDIIMEENPIPIHQRNPNLPPLIAAVVDKSVSRKADDRYQTALEFKQALLTALESSQISAIDTLPLTDKREVDTILRSSGGNLPFVTIHCARCGADMSDLANSDGRAGELGADVIYWCPDCSWRQFPLQTYRMNEMGTIEYQGLGGGLASTALGWQASTGRVAAIRRVYFWRDREQSANNLLADLDRLATIVHPNCTRIIQTSSDFDAVLVASVYVQDGTFGELVENCPGGTIPPLAVVTVGLKLLDGLEQVHSLGYVHANLHPGNILFQNRDFARPKICLADFNPRYVDSFASNDPERDNPIVNATSLPYLVPELIFGTSQREPAWDLYSLGQLLYVLLTGKISLDLPLAHNSRDWNELLPLLLKPEPVPIRDRAPGIPTRLAAVIDRAVHRLPEERYKTIAEFSHALHHAQEEL
jgi:serine/threonine protein kinase